MMNNEAYSAYPSEGEFLLSEGCGVNILAVERNFTIKNFHPSLDKYDGKVLTIVHLYHYSLFDKFWNLENDPNIHKNDLL